MAVLFLVLLSHKTKAAEDINKGDKFTKDNITIKRPGTGISPMKWDEIIGKASEKDYKFDDLIE